MPFLKFAALTSTGLAVVSLSAAAAGIFLGTINVTIIILALQAGGWVAFDQLLAVVGKPSAVHCIQFFQIETTQLGVDFFGVEIRAIHAQDLKYQY